VSTYTEAFKEQVGRKMMPAMYSL